MSEVVWQGLTAHGLDQQMNLRARWPDHEAVLARWSEESARVRRGLAGAVELAYGADPLQRIDLFPVAASVEPAPVLAFIHGGYWQSLDKADFTFLAPPFLAAGIAVAMLNYRMAPAVGMTEIVDDVARAVDCLAAEAPALGCEARMVLAGHSAGGHLAVTALVRERHAVAEGRMRPRIRAACSISGIYDLAPISRSYQQPILRIDEREVGELSPLRNAPASAPPLMLAVGDRETPEFVRQQGALACLWQALDLPVTELRVAGADHFTVVDVLSESDHLLTRWLSAACLAEQRGKTE